MKDGMMAREIDPYTEAEIATVKRFLDYVAEEFLDSDQGIVGYNDDGVTVAEWTDEYSYGDSYLEKTETFIPWVAFTDLEEWARQQHERKLAEGREQEQAEREWKRERETEERRVYELLKAKFESI